MIEHLTVASTVMAIVSLGLISAGVIFLIERSKAYNFLCGVSSFVTTITLGCLVVLGVGQHTIVWFVMWFFASIIKFAEAAFRETK
jgi:hypothetical protein